MGPAKTVVVQFWFDATPDTRVVTSYFTPSIDHNKILLKFFEKYANFTTYNSLVGSYLTLVLETMSYLEAVLF